ncbi:hypothetical protein [Pseudarcicella hirudinis]|nr:hypothetical protein [Pseudarcicella hirudinis]
MLLLVSSASAQGPGENVGNGRYSTYNYTVSLQDKAFWTTARNYPPGYFVADGTGPNGGGKFINGDDFHNINGYLMHIVGAANQGLIFPVGSGTDLRTLTTSGSIPVNMAIATAWMVGDPSTTLDPTDYPPNATHSIKALASGIAAVSPSGQWDWFPQGGSVNGVTVTVSIPNMSDFASADKLRLVGWNGTQWIALGTEGASTNTENAALSGTMMNGVTAIAIGTTALSSCATISSIVKTNPQNTWKTDGAITLSGLTAANSYAIKYSFNGIVQTWTANIVDASGNIKITGFTKGTYDNFILRNTDTGCSTDVLNGGSVVLTD